MTVSVNGTTGITFNDASTQNTAANGFGFKNRLINGAMMIDQRNAGASVTPVGATYTLDRWRFNTPQPSKYSVQQNAGSVTPPVGFTNYLGVTSLSSYAVISSDAFICRQAIEGFNCADLSWGTANASPVTLSFWVRSSLTGTFGGALSNNAEDRSYPFSYTISAANTFEYKTITVAGDTTGTWLTTNGIGIRVIFGIGVGSTYSGTAGAWSSGFYVSATGATSVVGTNGATFYITGVQLEKGSTATSFDYRPYGTELQLCQRYFSVVSNGLSGICLDTTRVAIAVSFPTVMRAQPSVSSSSVLRVSDIYTNAFVQSSSGISFRDGSALVASGATYAAINFSGFTAGRAVFVETNAGTQGGAILLSAEL